MKIIVGIDPGQKGGLAFLSGRVSAYPMPLVGKELDISTIVELIRLNCTFSTDIITAFVEKVHSMPKQGVASSFKFGKSFGCLLGIFRRKIPQID